MKKAEGEYKIELNIACPYCRSCNDYFDTITANDYNLSCESESDLEIEIKCFDCGKFFVLEKTIF